MSQTHTVKAKPDLNLENLAVERILPKKIDARVISSGDCYGPIFVPKPLPTFSFHRHSIIEYAGEIPAKRTITEIEKFVLARKAVGKFFKNKVRDAKDTNSAEIFRTLNGIVSDHTFKDSVISRIKGEIKNANEHSICLKAEYAVVQTVDFYIKLYGEKDFTKRLIPDLKEVQQRYLEHMVYGEFHAALSDLKEPSVILTKNLSTTEAAQLDPTICLGIISQNVQHLDHTGIAARYKQIPCVSGVDIDSLPLTTGDMVIIDAEHDPGLVYINPREEELEQIHRSIQREVLKKRTHPLSSGTHTRCGTPVTLTGSLIANDGIQRVKEIGAKSVGLYRTEFLFNQSILLPEDQQTEIYCSAMEHFQGGYITFRLLDLGVDKQFGDITENDASPFGERSLRLLLNRQNELLRPQLRALLRASTTSACGVRILVPMVPDLNNFLQLKTIFEDEKSHLVQNGIQIDNNVSLGAQIETPSAVLCAWDIAKHADFINIGTNDLTQYTLVVNRQSFTNSQDFLPHHPSVVRALDMIFRDVAHDHPDICLCGDMPSNPKYIPILLGLGYRNFSVDTGFLEQVNHRIAILDIKECEELVDLIIGKSDKNGRRTSGISDPNKIIKLLDQLGSQLKDREP